MLTLVRSNTNACQDKTHVEGPDYQVLKIKTKSSELHLVNYYCPKFRQLSLNTVEILDSRLLIIGDFNIHLQNWGGGGGGGGGVYTDRSRGGDEVED